MTGVQQLSQDLNSALSLAGFIRPRAGLQSSVADVMQEILRRRCQDDGLCVVGSFSEGWGNSLSRLNGRTDLESDIDVTQLLAGRLYHIRGLCKCAGVKDKDLVDYKNGHIMSSGFASTPARAEEGSALRPAVDRVDACRLCCYPPIRPLSQDKRSASNIPVCVLQALNHEIAISPCHVVNAAPPGEDGNQLRVSTTFLEKRLLRSLSSIQGQLFVSLKYLVKKVISRKVQGLKAYHAKTLTFRMLEDTPADEWQASNLVTLIRRALRMLIANVENISNSPDGRVMDHFFLIDTAIYLKGDNRSSDNYIADVLRDTFGHLNSLLRSFIEQLESVESTGRFYFHPFLIIPVVDPHPVAQSEILQYHDIYDVVRDAVIRLGEGVGCDELDSLSKSIGRLPDCAKTTRECLRAMVRLKLGKREEAVRIVTDCACDAVSRGFDFSATLTEDSPIPTSDFVFTSLTRNDSAWRFCFQIDRRPEWKFLPKNLAESFPGVLENYMDYIYVNFDALFKCLRFELLPVDCDQLTQARAWFKDADQRMDSDTQDKLMALHYCPDYEWRKMFILKFDLHKSRDRAIINKAQEILHETDVQSRDRIRAQVVSLLETTRNRLTDEQIAFFENQIHTLDKMFPQSSDHIG